jgi:hypothetical protein
MTMMIRRGVVFSHVNEGWELGGSTVGRVLDGWMLLARWVATLRFSAYHRLP